VTDEPKKLRFLTIAQAAEELNVNQNQIRALLRTGELRGIQVGGRGYLGQLVGLESSMSGIPGCLA
jgi:excisionase family DNA binding protein